MYVNFRNWTGTMLVAVVAGFIIFGLLRGQEILSKFLKSEPTKAIPADSSKVPVRSRGPSTLREPTKTKTPTPSLTSTLTPTPVSIFTPAPTPIQQQAQCESGQVDINTAPKEELIKIKHIGDVRADELISLRPFSSVDDLERVKGIGGPGSKTLTDIKEQGIACVE